MTYKPDWYKKWDYTITPDNGYRLEIPNSATDKIIVGNRNNELLSLVMCLFDLVNIKDEMINSEPKQTKS